MPLLLVLALLQGSLLSQETTFHSQSNIVLIPALVKNQKGEVVYGLAAKDFVVEDDGVEQQVHLDEAAAGETQPISMVIAIQRGRRANYEFPRIRGLSSMLEPIFSQGQARVALLEFDSQVEVTRPFTKDGSLIAADLKNLQPGDGKAAILDAIDYAVNLLAKEAEGRVRILLLVSETRDHGSVLVDKLDGIVAAIGQSNTLVYTLAFSPSLSNVLDTGRGNNINEMGPSANYLQLMAMAVQAMRKNVPHTIAAMTGGEYEMFDTQKKFDARMIDFTNHLHSRYQLSIEPKNPHPGLHQLSVRLKQPGSASLLARTSYWAQGAAQ